MYLLVGAVVVGIKRGLRSFYWRFKDVLVGATLYLGATTFDNITSMQIGSKNLEESNPFARHADGSFWLRHALITEGINTLEVIAISAALYLVVRTLGEKWAKFAATVPWLYYGYVHLDAAFTNILMEIPGLYVHTLREIMEHMLGVN
jgi:hypothetical protein